MFGNRKRKPQDEESLVPHGLIWHATAEPTPEENVTSNEESLGHTVQFAQGIEQARRPQPALEAQSGPLAVPQPPIPVSAPLRWWRLQQPEPEPDRPVVKPILMPLSAYAPPPPIEPDVELPRVPQVPLPRISAPQVSSPHVSMPRVEVPQVPQASAAQVAQPPVPQVPVTRVLTPVQPPYLQTPQVRKLEGEVRKPTVPNTPPAAPKSKRVSEALSGGVAWLSASIQDAWRTAASAYVKVRGSWSRVSQSVELRQALLRAGKQGQDLLRRGAARSRGYAQATQSTTMKLSRAGIERLKQMSARGRSVSSAGTKQISALTKQRFNSQRIRTAVASPVARAKTLLAEPMSQWKAKRDRVAIDSRFWSSMTMAAISALIVLGIVSVVPNYAAKSLPSRILGSNSSINANVAAPVVLAAPPQANKPAAKKTVNPEHAQAKPASPRVAAPPKAHRAADADYVAPDTYKYYGNGSKRSR